MIAYLLAPITFNGLRAPLNIWAAVREKYGDLVFNIRTTTDNPALPSEFGHLTLELSTQRHSYYFLQPLVAKFRSTQAGPGKPHEP